MAFVPGCGSSPSARSAWRRWTSSRPRSGRSTSREGFPWSYRHPMAGPPGSSWAAPAKRLDPEFCEALSDSSPFGTDLTAMLADIRKSIHRTGSEPRAILFRASPPVRDWASLTLRRVDHRLRSPANRCRTYPEIAIVSGMIARFSSPRGLQRRRSKPSRLMRSWRRFRKCQGHHLDLDTWFRGQKLRDCEEIDKTAAPLEQENGHCQGSATAAAGPERHRPKSRATIPNR